MNSTVSTFAPTKRSRVVPVAPMRPIAVSVTVRDSGTTGHGGSDLRFWQWSTMSIDNRFRIKRWGRFVVDQAVSTLDRLEWSDTNAHCRLFDIDGRLVVSFNPGATSSSIGDLVAALRRAGWTTQSYQNDSATSSLWFAPGRMPIEKKMKHAS